MPAAATVARPEGTGVRNEKHRLEVDTVVLGAASITAGAARYLQKLYLAASVTELRHLLNKPPGWKGKITRLYVVVGTAPGGFVVDTITVRVNGADTAIAGTITGTATTLEVGGNIDVSPGDDIEVRYTAGGGSAAANVMAYVAVEDR